MLVVIEDITEILNAEIYIYNIQHNIYIYTTRIPEILIWKVLKTIVIISIFISLDSPTISKHDDSFHFIRLVLSRISRIRDTFP